MQAARIPVSESLLWAAHSPCTVRVTRKLPAIFEWIWSGPCNSSNPRGLLFISWQNHTDPDLCFQSKDSGWGAFSHWVVRPSMEQWPPGLFLHFLLLFFFLKWDFFSSLKPGANVGEGQGQGSEGGTLSLGLNLVPLSLTSHPHLLFCLKSARLP